MSVKLFQVFYKEGQPLDEGCIPVDAIGMDVAPLFESTHIINLYNNGLLNGADYYGLTSWRMFEKTGLTKKEIDQFIQNNPRYDVYLYGQQGEDDQCLVKNIQAATTIGIAWQRLSQLPLFKDSSVVDQPWINCFCNYWLASKPIWDRYMDYLHKTINLFEDDQILKWIMENITFPFRDKPYPLQCFVLEYLFGLFLKDNPDITYKYIPTKFTPDVRAREPKENDTRSLMEINENHKSDIPGRGDKGTLHTYIETYEKLLSSYRREPINFLEIGVAEGYSMRLWREYFTKARLTGIDLVHPGCNTTGWWFRQADQSSEKELNTVLRDEQFDVIIDDGSHMLEHQIASFKILFPRIKKGGIYIIEDIGGQSNTPDIDIAILKKEFGDCEVYDFRKIKNRYDDILMVWKK